MQQHQPDKLFKASIAHLITWFPHKITIQKSKPTHAYMAMNKPTYMLTMVQHIVTPIPHIAKLPTTTSLKWIIQIKNIH